MKDEQLTRAQQIKKELKDLGDHKLNIEKKFKINRDQREYQNQDYGFSELKIGYSNTSNYTTTLIEKFAPLDDTTFLNIYLQKLDNHLKLLQTEFDNL